MSEKIEKAESDGTHIKYTTDKGRQLSFDLSTGEGMNNFRAFVTSLGLVGVSYAEELVGFTLPAGI